MLRALRAAGVEPLAFADNNPCLWRTTVDGVRVVPPSDAVLDFGDAATFVVSVYTRRPFLAQLRELGVRPASAQAVLFHLQGSFIPHASIDWPENTLSQAEAVIGGCDLWADDVSREEYVRQIRWRLVLEDQIPDQSTPVDTYFPGDLVTFGPDDHWVDCGAFDGDTVRAIIERSGGRFRQITAIEPDTDNFRRLKGLIQAQPEEYRSKIIAHRVAAGDRHGIARFSATATAGSAFSPEGTVEVECVRLDDLLAGTRPTFIKMDVEGAEPKALQGASSIIRTARPVMAVCLYHSQSHLWQLPSLIKSFDPDYRLFLRRHSDDCWETVCYALPT
jgi:FkbM family methyltransferase